MIKNNLKFLKTKYLSFLLIILLIGLSVFVGACSKKDSAPSQSATTSVLATTVTPTPTLDPNAAMAIDPLTGVKDMDPRNVGLRSAAFSINNHPQALPSRGISLADVVYEFETEGGQTRFLAVFPDIAKVPEVGSLRSARIIACDLSAGTNSIFIHYGKNNRVPDYLSNNQIDHIDGNDYSAESGQSVNGVMDLPEGIYFWRSDDWKATRALEHTAVTNGANVLRAMKDKDIDIKGDTPSLFTFTTKPTPDLVNGNPCNKILVYFSSNNPDSTFLYDAKTKLYAKSEYNDQPQVDETNKQQVKVTNVFVLFANIQNHGDTTIDAYLADGGTGYYASEGKIIEVNWTKTAPHAPIVVTDKNGKEITVNAGKSYINVVRQSVSDRTVIS